MSFFDRILKSLEGIFEGRAEVDEITRKFVSGLFYCGGVKRTYFALTFDTDDEDREDEMIRFLEESHPECSDMRINHGYSTETLSMEEAEEEGWEEFDEIEVGTL